MYAKSIHKISVFENTLFVYTNLVYILDEYCGIIVLQ